VRPTDCSYALQASSDLEGRFALDIKEVETVRVALLLEAYNSMTIATRANDADGGDLAVLFILVEQSITKTGVCKQRWISINNPSQMNGKHLPVDR
jgi:hypothetical protein